MPKTPTLRQKLQYPEGETFTAGRYLGQCPCGAALNATYIVVRRGDDLYHAACDPQSRTWPCTDCGAAITSERQCDACYPAHYSLWWMARALADALNPEPSEVPSGFRR